MKCLALIALLLLTGAVHAQAPGVDCVPIQGQGWQGCAPVGPQQQPAAHWADRWGAIASYEPGGVLGVAVNMSSKEEAERVAMTDCQTKGGGSNCKLVRWYNNQCVAFTVSAKGYNSAAAATIDAAAKKGLEICTQSGDPNCHTYYTACSLPVQVQ